MSTVANCEPQPGMLMPIALSTLCASEMLDFDLYLQAGLARQPVLYRQRSYPFTQGDLESLVERGVQTLYIVSADASHYRDHLCETILKNENIPPLKRYQALREATRTVLSEALGNDNCDAAVEVTRDLSKQMVQTVCESKLILSELLQAMSHDYSRFTSAMNVATYCLVLAQKWGITNEQDLLRIGQGALLHDIGMRHVPRHILDKPAKFTARERHIVQRHTVMGFLELCRRDDLTTGQLMMVYGHHERCDGGGYPCGLVRSEIHEYARICAIADSYAAMLGDRSHRRAARKSNVISYLDRQAGRAFDEELTRCWLAAVGDGD
jgi:HD-GYP domain-containing protein (c-di-GMP phosphodiesterase class II)